MAYGGFPYLNGGFAYKQIHEICLIAEFIHDLPVVAGLRIASFEKQRNPDYHITSDSNVSDKYFCFVQPGFNRLLTTFFSLRPYRPWVLFLARAKENLGEICAIRKRYQD